MDSLARRLAFALAATALAGAAAAEPRRADARQVESGPVKVAAAAIAPRSLPPLLHARDRETLARAFAAAEAGRWDDARRLASTTGDRLGAKILRWLDMQRPRSGASFEDIAAFMDANPDWPAQEILNRRAEEALILRVDDSVVRAWFASRAPATVDGALRLLDALQRSGGDAQVPQLVRDTWAVGAFGTQQEGEFLRRFGHMLVPADDERRADRLIWDGRYAEAQRVLARLDGGARALAEARIKLATQARDAEAALHRVPPSLQDDSGLLFERARWQRRKGDDAYDLVRRAGAGKPEVWWREREYWARRLLREGRAREAHALARDHGLAPGSSAYADAEFLAGFIALRRLDEPAAARQHFEHLGAAARFPVTQARGAYWAGRAAEAQRDEEAAQALYRRAASFPVAYYGQLALLRLAPDARPGWSPPPPASAAERAAFDAGELARAARLLADIGEAERVKHFVRRLVDVADTPTAHRLAAELALALGRPDLAVSAAKRSAQRAGVMLPEQGWPVIATGAVAGAPERALVLATIRQESAFEADAVSRAGARGLMQLMPATAKAVAKQLGVHGQHRDKRLTTDPDYNLRLGQTYLAGLIGDYSGSYLIALAAYNAGPGRAQSWLRDNGDPRGGMVDPVDWVELIGIEETRNYVQRVMENVQVYRRLLARADATDALEKDFARGFR